MRFSEAVQQSGLEPEPCLRPAAGVERAPGGVDRPVHLGGAGDGHPPPGELGVGVDAAEGLARLGADPRAADEHPELPLDFVGLR